MLCIGHGGASAVAPANSLSAFALAAALGADRIEFDVRAWRGRLVLAHTAFHAQVGRPLRLDDALAALSGPRFAGVGFVVDLKSAGTARAVVDALRLRGLFERSLITSQSPASLAAVRLVAPSGRVGISIAGRVSRHLQRWGEWRGEVLAAIAAGRYDAVMAHHRLIDSDLVARVGAAGAELHAWTVGCPEAMRSLAGLGVDGIVTGDPRLLRATIAV